MNHVVDLETVAATRIVTIRRPDARNALDGEALAQLTRAFTEASADPLVRCVVLTGAGAHFCSGADLKKLLMDDPSWHEHLDGYMDAFHALVKALVRCTKPTLAALDGAAVGFGADLALACDIRVATRRAYVQEKFVEIGLMPDGGGTFWLPRLLGTARAMHAILLAERLDAQALEALGIVSRVVDPDELRAAALAIATRLEAGPPLAFAAIKRAVYASWGPLEDALCREREEQLLLLRSADFAEGVAAWAQKRTPSFQGK